MNPKLRLFLYGIGVFIVYLILTAVVILISGRNPENPILFGIYTKEHLLIGLAVAVVLSLSHDRKMKMMKK